MLYEHSSQTWPCWGVPRLRAAWTASRNAGFESSDCQISALPMTQVTEMPRFLAASFGGFYCLAGESAVLGLREHPS